MRLGQPLKFNSTCLWMEVSESTERTVEEQFDTVARSLRSMEMP